jgi:hypothetical protein
MDQRREFALKALGTLNFRALCQEYGSSAKTGYKWRERFLRQGLEGMEEDSRRPRSSPKQLSESQVCEMVKLKLVHRHWGPRKIRTLSGFDSDAASITLICRSQQENVRLLPVECTGGRNLTEIVNRVGSYQYPAGTGSH